MAETIGQRIKRARLEAGLTQPELAKRCGWDSQGRISNYERDLREPKRGDLEAIARALNVGVSWLWNGDSISRSMPPSVTSEDGLVPVANQIRNVPELSWVQAGAWTSVDVSQVDISEAKHWPCPVPCSPQTFALRVKGDSMAPYFPQDFIIFVDPEVVPLSGRKVVAMLSDSNEATFKQYIEDGGHKMLKAMNPNWPEPYIAINGNCRIVGTVVFAGAEV